MVGEVALQRGSAGLEDDACERELPVALAHHRDDVTVPASSAPQYPVLKEEIRTRGMSVGDVLVSSGSMLACSLPV